MPKPKDILDRIETHTPCNADWNEMAGNEQVRFCSHCNLSVHNLSTMTRQEALRLVLNSKGSLCARYTRRPDGTVHTTDSMRGQLYAIKRRASRLAAGAFTAALSLSSGAMSAAASTTHMPNSASAVHAVSRAEGAAFQTTGAGSAYLSGVVKDVNGAVIAGASVTLYNQQDGESQSTLTNDEGWFFFQEVAEGSYSLMTVAQGFAANTQGLALQSGEMKSTDVTLELGVEVISGGVALSMPEQPLVAAVVKDDLEEVKQLLASGADINAVDENYGATALGEAVASGKRPLVTYLLNAGADVNAKNSEGQNVLMQLTTWTTGDIVWDLVNAGAEPNLRDDDGSTPLIHAAAYASREALQALLDAGAEVDARDECERTALMAAVGAGDEQKVLALLKAGAMVNLRDEDGKTAFQLAKNNNCDDAVLRVLKEYGGVE